MHSYAAGDKTDRICDFLFSYTPHIKKHSTATDPATQFCYLQLFFVSLPKQFLKHLIDMKELAKHKILFVCLGNK